jgi:predicted GH43/DUF377 family glycosyl hydrolase
MPGNYWFYPSGLALYDENGRMISCAKDPQIIPTTEYELRGFEDKQVSLCTGLELVEENNTKVVRAYFGAGDRHVMVAEAPLQECLDFLFSPENIVEGTGSGKVIGVGGLEGIITTAA